MKMDQMRSVIAGMGKRLCLAPLSASVVLAGCQGPERPRPLAQDPPPAKAETRAATKAEPRPLASMDARTAVLAKPAAGFAPYHAPAQSIAPQPSTYLGV